jgi:hypothetical protein
MSDLNDLVPILLIQEASDSIFDENDHYTNFSWFLVYFPYFDKDI